MQATAIVSETGDLTLSGITAPVPWWSFTKTVLSIASLRLVENGLLSLDQPLGNARFNLRQLLRHESGLPDYGYVSEYHSDVAAGKAPWPIERLLATVDADRLWYKPGAEWAYSNIGYLKVAQLIEQASGLTLKVALEQLVFGPSNLATARLALVSADLDNVQMGNIQNYHPGWVFHGLVVGTVADAARLLQALMAGKLLKSATLAEMLQGRPLPEHGAVHSDPAYGLGLMLRANNSLDYPLGHMGEGPGSRIAVLARGRRVAAVWTTLPSTVDAEAHAIHLLS
ncbi:serine hydrolase domain-containing protein [Tunturiibacter lichenicola]|uniref:serine hydrolase domain-containing protein n=1 Tax=Tunturiibacter lichenicola TaxID=2051959 RepID=UPI0021B29110|nr:serine hydrolase domain-containing protein [Edaphobacter lichenicola]